MKRVLLAATLLAVCSAQAAAQTPGNATPARFAIVIGNNRPADPKQVTLRYADDDAFATKQLLTEAGVNVTLLVTPDADTRAQYPSVSYREATQTEFERSAVEIAKRVQAVIQRGGTTEFSLFYSGHGDRDDAGEGYVLFEGGRRFTRSMLASLLKRIGATRNHVIVDACKSSFFLFDRGAGGEHTPYTGLPLALATPALVKNTGFILSTSSGRESHEYERFHAGILSHELRSALRGAADVDHDGKISYAEVGGFLNSANAAILPRFRPDFLVVPPGRTDATQPFLIWSLESSIVLADSNWGHVYVETARGERIADLHPAADGSTSLWTPAERPLYVKRNDETLEYPVLETAGRQSVDPNTGRIPTVADRGAPSEAFNALFVSPFGPADIERFESGMHSIPPSASEQTPASTRSVDATPALLGPWLIAGSAAAFGASAIVFGILTRAEYDRVAGFAQTCEANCKVRIRERQVSGRTYQALTNISLGLTAAAVATAVTWFVLDLSGPESESEPSVSVGPGSIHLAGRF